MLRNTMKNGLVVLALLGSTVAFAASSTTPTPMTGTTMSSSVTMPAGWSSMTMSQKKAAVKQAWDNLTPAQQAQVKTEAKNKWNSMTPDQQQTIISKVMNAMSGN